MHLVLLIAGLLHDAYVQDEVDKDREMHAHLYSSNWWVHSVVPCARACVQPSNAVACLTHMHFNKLRGLHK
jgi:hypothetical protein